MQHDMRRMCNTTAEQMLQIWVHYLKVYQKQIDK